MELTTILIISLLAAGIIGSIIPMMPGALFSLVGILVYFFGSSKPSIWFTVFGLLTVGSALVFDWFAGSIAARYGGASTKTSIAAGFTGLLGFIFLGGPIGLAVAVMATVFVREYLIHGDERKGLKSAVYATVGVLGSAVVQALLTGSVLLAFLISIVI